MLNTGHGVMADQRFRSDLKDWIDANAPYIKRKEAWQGTFEKKHVRLWHNTRMSHLRLTESNDACYLIGDPGREAWVGPEV